MARRDTQRQGRPPMTSCRGCRRRRCQPNIAFRPILKWRDQSLPFALRPLLLPRLQLLWARVRGNIFECDCTLHLLAGENGLVAPLDKDADIAGLLRRHACSSRPGLFSKAGSCARRRREVSAASHVNGRRADNVIENGGRAVLIAVLFLLLDLRRGTQQPTS